MRLTLTQLFIPAGIFVILGCSPGCKPSTTKDLYGDLFYSANNYYNGLRWQQFSLSAQALPVGKREAFIHKREAQRDHFRVVDFEVRSHKYDPVESEAVLRVDYRWYRTDDTTVRTTRMRQDWKYNESRSSWELVEQAEEEIKDEEDSKESKDLL